jgi:restriction endonuclease
VKSSDKGIGSMRRGRPNEYGMLVTLGTYTPPALSFAKGKPNLRLIDGSALVKKPVPRVVESTASRQKKVFASMPFSGKYDDTFLVAIQPSALALRGTEKAGSTNMLYRAGYATFQSATQSDNQL